MIRRDAKSPGSLKVTPDSSNVGMKSLSEYVSLGSENVLKDGSMVKNVQGLRHVYTLHAHYET